MKTTPYLIQRLKRPFPPQEDSENKTIFQKLENIFSFGGGRINGGLSDEAMKILRDVWRYDYMGSSEFEWGAVPESLKRIAQNNSKYITGQIEVEASTYNMESKDKKDKYIHKKGLVFYACIKGDEPELIEWIGKFANEKKQNYHTKESVNLGNSICGNEDSFYREVKGWHDIENDYLFFTDKEMFDNFCIVMKIK